MENEEQLAKRMNAAFGKRRNPSPQESRPRASPRSSSQSSEALEDLSLSAEGLTAAAGNQRPSQPSSLQNAENATFPADSPAADRFRTPNPNLMSSPPPTPHGIAWKLSSLASQQVSKKQWADLVPVKLEPWDHVLPYFCAPSSSLHPSNLQEGSAPRALTSLLLGSSFSSASDEEELLTDKSSPKLSQKIRNGVVDGNDVEPDSSGGGKQHNVTRMRSALTTVPEVSPTCFQRETEFFAVGLRYLLPLRRQRVTEVLNFLVAVERSYQNVSYHHQGHAALVTHASILMTKACGVWPQLNNDERTSFTIACLGHDIGHPGRNADFLSALNHPLSRVYNGKSILENYHSFCVLRILDHSSCNLFGGLSSKTMVPLRKLMVDCILATDLSQQEKMLREIKARLNEAVTKRRKSQLLEDSDVKQDSLNMCIKAGDLAYMTLESPDAMIQWTRDYYEELASQNWIEVHLGLSKAGSLAILGSPLWFRQNAKFVVETIQPIGHYLAEVEYRLRSNSNVRLPHNETETEQGEGPGASTGGGISKLVSRGFDPEKWNTGSVVGRHPYTVTSASSQVAVVREFCKGDVQQLADDLAEVDLQEVIENPRPVALRKGSISSSSVSRVSSIKHWLTKAKSTITPLVERQATSSAAKSRRQTHVWKIFVEPLERNAELLELAAECNEEEL